MGSSSPRTVFCFDDDVFVTQGEDHELGAPNKKDLVFHTISSTTIATQETTATNTSSHHLLPRPSSEDDSSSMSSTNAFNQTGGTSNLGSQGPITLEMVYNLLQEVTMKRARNASRLLNLAIHDENGQLRGHGMLIKSRVTSAEEYFLVSCAHVLSKLFNGPPNTTTTLRFHDGTIQEWQRCEMFAPQAVLSQNDFAIASGYINYAKQATLLTHDFEIYTGDLRGSKVLSSSNLIETEGSANTVRECKSKIYVSATSTAGASGTNYIDAQNRLVSLVVGARLYTGKLDFQSKTAFAPYNYGVRFPVGKPFGKVTRPDIMDLAFYMMDSTKPEDEIRKDLSKLLNCPAHSTIEQFDAALTAIAFDWNCTGLPIPDKFVTVLGLPV